MAGQLVALPCASLIRRKSPPHKLTLGFRRETLAGGTIAYPWTTAPKSSANPKPLALKALAVGGSRFSPTAGTVGSFFLTFVPSWWKIADSRPFVAYPIRLCRTGRCLWLRPLFSTTKARRSRRSDDVAAPSVHGFSWLAGSVHSQQLTR